MIDNVSMDQKRGNIHHGLKKEMFDKELINQKMRIILGGFI